MMTVEVRINRDVLYRIRAVNQSQLADISDYRVEVEHLETGHLVHVQIKRFRRDRGALALISEILEAVERAK